MRVAMDNPGKKLDWDFSVTAYRASFDHADRIMRKPAGERTWLSQSTCVLPIVGSTGTAYLFLGDHWFGTDDMSGATSGKDNSLATYVLQPLIVNGAKISMPKYLASWKLDIGAGTWTE